MTSDEGITANVRHWSGRAHESLASAGRELSAGAPYFAVNRAYYAAFYATKAVLLVKGLRFKKHSGVRDAFHLQLIKPGLLSADWAVVYERLFLDRLKSDYVELVTFDPNDVRAMIADAAGLVAALEALLPEHLRRLPG